MENALRLDLAALASFEMAVVKLDPSGVCTYANAAAGKLLGPRKAIGWSLQDLFPGKGEIEVVKAELKKRLQGEASSYVTRFARPDGTKVPVSIYAFPVLDGDGHVSGSMAIVTDLRRRMARKAMHHAIESSASGKEILKAVAGELEALVRFDEFRVMAISADGKHLQRVFSTDPQADDRFPYKWWPIPPFLQETLAEEKPRIINIPAMFKEPGYVDMLRDDPLAQKFLDSGVLWTLSIPVLAGRKIAGFIALDSRGYEYTQDDLVVCDRLPLGDAVNIATQREKERRLKAYVELMRELGTQSMELQQVAQLIVDTLAAEFHWDHVAIYQHQPQTREFSLLCEGSDTGKHMPKDKRTLEWGTGVVGRAFSRRKEVIVSNVKGKGPDAQAYVEGVPGMVSALAISIPGEPPRWVLNVESRLESAFINEEVQLLRMLVAETGQILDRVSLLETRLATLSAIKDAVIETDQDGVIRDINSAGWQLLGAASAKDIVGRQIQELVPDPAVAAALLESGGFSRREIEMRTLGRKDIPVLLSGSRLPPGIGGLVFVASDLTYLLEMQRTELLKDVFRHASLECRVPLAIASGWLAKLASGHREVAGDVDQVLEQIRKADMPLERLLRVADAAPAERGKQVAHDLRKIVGEAVAQFPANERDYMEVELPDQEVPVQGAPEDLRFCVETSLSFAFRTKPQNKRIEVRMKVEDGNAMLSVGGDWSPALGTEPAPAIRQRWRRTAASDLALAEDVIENIMERAQGNFQSEMEDHLRLSFELPLATGG